VSACTLPTTTWMSRSPQCIGCRWVRSRTLTQNIDCYPPPHVLAHSRALSRPPSVSSSSLLSMFLVMLFLMKTKEFVDKSDDPSFLSEHRAFILHVLQAPNSLDSVRQPTFKQAVHKCGASFSGKVNSKNRLRNWLNMCEILMRVLSICSYLYFLSLSHTHTHTHTHTHPHAHAHKNP
jgi:hypothetical protein